MVNRLGVVCRVEIAMFWVIALRGVVQRVLNWLFSRVCLWCLKHLAGTKVHFFTNKVVACGKIKVARESFSMKGAMNYEGL